MSFSVKIREMKSFIVIILDYCLLKGLYFSLPRISKIFRRSGYKAWMIAACFFQELFFVFHRKSHRVSVHSLISWLSVFDHRANSCAALYSIYSTTTFFASSALYSSSFYAMFLLCLKLEKQLCVRSHNILGHQFQRPLIINTFLLYCGSCCCFCFDCC